MNTVNFLLTSEKILWVKLIYVHLSLELNILINQFFPTYIYTVMKRIKEIPNGPIYHFVWIGKIPTILIYQLQSFWVGGAKSSGRFQ